MELTNSSINDKEIVAVLQILYENGINVSNPKRAYEELKCYESNASFCIILSYLFQLEQCPITDINLPGSWIQYRHLAGITLKNNLARARHALGEHAVKIAASCALHVLRSNIDRRLLRVAAQITVQVTHLTSFEWWMHAGVGNLSQILLEELLSLGDLHSVGALYTLQYLMEDLNKSLGFASAEIICKVTNLITAQSIPMVEPTNDSNLSSVVNSNSNDCSPNCFNYNMEATYSLEIRKAAFKMCYNVYEQASFLEWNIDNLSPWQQGLVSASWRYTQACTRLLRASCHGDESWLIQTLRACLLLLDYFEYFTSYSREDERLMCSTWCAQTIEIICAHCDDFRLPGNEELVSVAIDLINVILTLYDESGGDGATAFLIEPVDKLIPKLLPSLVHYSTLSNDEIESIMSKDDYRIRDSTSNSHKNCSLEKHVNCVRSGEDELRGSTRGNFANDRSTIKDITSDDLLDDEVAAMTLRSSALKCVDTLCLFATDKVFHLLIAEIQRLWMENEWKKREVGIVLVGTIAKGCASQLESYLEKLVAQLLCIISNTTEHVCVVSIAMWSLSRLIESVLVIAPHLLDSIVQTLRLRLQSQSRRIQLTSVSALNVIITCAMNYQRIDLLEPKFESLLSAITVCLPVYTTGNLSLLIDLLSKIIMYICHDPEAMHCIEATLQQEQVQRAKQFEESYGQVYIHDVANALIDKDIFHIERGLLVVRSSLSNVPQIEFELRTWSVILQDMLSRGVDDDYELIYSTIYLLCGNVRLLSSAQINTWAASSSSMMLVAQGVMALQNFRFKSLQVQQAAVMLLSLLSRSLYSNINSSNNSNSTHEMTATSHINHGTNMNNASHTYFNNNEVKINELISYCATLLVETDSTNFKFDLVQLLVSLTVYQLPLSADDSAQIITVVLNAMNETLRSDVFGDTLYLFIAMAFNVCTMIDKLPRVLPAIRTDVLCQLLTQAENDEQKAIATVTLSNALVHELQVSLFAELLPHYLRLVYSWQQMANNYDGLQSAICCVLHRATQECVTVLQSLLNALPPQFRQFITHTYNIHV